MCYFAGLLAGTEEAKVSQVRSAALDALAEVIKVSYIYNSSYLTSEPTLASGGAAVLPMRCLQFWARRINSASRVQ